MTYSYDEAGNRTQMTDGQGSTTYNYDSLSRLREERRTFAGLNNNTVYGIGYDYSLAGQLKSVTYPSGAVINYRYDQVGRLDLINGSGFGGVTQDYDGDGRRVKRVEAVSTTSGSPPLTTTTTTTVYEVRSTVLGGVLEGLDAQGARTVDYVYGGTGIVIARGGPSGATFVNHQAVTGSEQLSWAGAVDSGRTELDPLGGDVGTFQPVEDDPGRDFHARLVCVARDLQSRRGRPWSRLPDDIRGDALSRDGLFDGRVGDTLHGGRRDCRLQSED